jgi:beta-lactamase class D
MANKACVRALLALILPVAAAGCAPPTRDRVNEARLNADIDASIGGLGTCVVVLDTESGRKVYQYGHFDICTRQLPPCETFEPAAALIALDAGLITPQTVMKWDGSPQPTKAWQADADLARAFQTSNGWWFANVSRQIGAARYAAVLRAFGYGNHDVGGPITRFWQGPAQGGALAISAKEQASFVRRLYTGELKVKPASAQAVQALLVNESRGDATMSGAAGSCADQADRGRGAGWWVGRLKSTARDLTFAAVVEAPEPPPGPVVASAIKDAFADAKLWPAS